MSFGAFWDSLRDERRGHTSLVVVGRSVRTHTHSTCGLMGPHAHAHTHTCVYTHFPPPHQCHTHIHIYLHTPLLQPVLGVPQSMRHWWENTEVRSVAVHLPARASHTRPPLDLNGWESEGGESEEDDGV